MACSISPPPDRLELSAAPPTRNGEGSTSGSDPVPSMTEVDFDTRKYRRSAFIPDYRQTMYPPEEPYYTHEIPFAPPPAAVSTRHSVWSAEPYNDLCNQKTNGSSTSTPRRNSIAPIFVKKAAAVASDEANSVWRYSSSPSKTDLTIGETHDNTKGLTSRTTSTAPIFAQKVATDKDSSSRRDSPSPGPVLRSKSGLVYGHSALHNGDAPVLSPVADLDRTSIASFQTAREVGVPGSRRYSDGAGLTSKNGYSSYAVQQPPLPRGNGGDSRTSRRRSDLSALNGGHNSPRNVSPVDSRRSVAAGQFSRSGAVSPITTYRSSSPMGNRPRNGTTNSMATNGLVSPITLRQNGGFSGAASIRSGSPNAQVTSPLARNSMAAPQQPAPATHGQKLSLNTQLAQPADKKSPTPSEADEEMDEVIALSPAVRAPLQNFRRSRSSLMLSATPDEPQQSLDTLVEGSRGRRYFGQDVDMNDLVANNLENAFNRL